MTKFTKVTQDISQYKPRMKPFFISTLSELRKIPVAFGSSTLQCKADGELELIHIDRKHCYAINRFGRKTEGLPALEELHAKFLRQPAMHSSTELLAEMYAVDLNGKPLPLPKFIHYLKGNDGYTAVRHANIHLGLFDLLSVDGFKGSVVDSAKRFEMMARNFNGKLCHVLDYIVPTDYTELERYYTEKVQKEGWEGLVIRLNGDTYKAKPNRDIDAVIIGINTNTKGYEKGLARSVKVALMLENGNFVELGDATVPSEAEARELFALTRVKVGEAGNAVLVKPLVIVKISHISLFPDTYNIVHDGKTLREIGTMQLVRMKSPRVVGYRKDKKVCVEDIGLSQIGE